ncbi:MAG: bifunctional 4-hydroxy-2-oxoglutarate aldolase/2-dehydro-3-deoxy-phosphogluconate aldolase [Clostridia bacterium]|nr:bifunctional 4-hydroxy-2-oxoglutarate aldolase/2-dehydro-3-deoxy-phosphogluconate aldolase [Clostridia bacterium]
MDVLKRLSNAGVVPVVVIDDAANAVPTAKALAAGGIDVMEITLRTAAGLDSIRAVADECPEVLVGAGTVLSVEQAKEAVKAGAKFIVSPGFDENVVKYCLEAGVGITPGCVTPTEITKALSYGLKVLKFFPANVYGGLSAMKALAAPFGSVKFIPTGGVSGANLHEYIAAPFIHAVGGSWLCQKADIATGNYDKITALCREARQTVLGYEFAHLGINMPDKDTSFEVCRQMNDAFGLVTKEGSSSNFAGGSIEVMNSQYLGRYGHIAMRTNSIIRAIADLGAKGYEVEMSTAKYKGDSMIAVYLKNEIGGFAVHLLQK